MTTLSTIILGIIFGLLISFAELNKYNTIAALSIFKNFTVAKTILLVIAVGMILLSIEINLGLADFHLKPFNLIGVVAGGIIFGIGMSILGYCPGTLPISLGQGSLDAFFGIVGGIAGGIVFSLLYPFLSPILGPNLGKSTLFTSFGSQFSTFYYVVVVILAFVFISIAYWLNRLDKTLNMIHDSRWIFTGIGLAVLNIFLFYKTGVNRPLGASTSYPYAGDTIFNFTDVEYYSTTIKSGAWQVKFLFGAMVGGFINALITRTFKFTLMHDFWINHRSKSYGGRVAAALVGGFILIFGARLADGCTSGHIISGGMQLSYASFSFAAATFVGFLTTGYLFYKK